MIPRAPKILFELPKTEAKWITREEAHLLLGRFPLHTRDMAMLAFATGLRKSNVAGWNGTVSTSSAVAVTSRASKAMTS